MDYRCGRIGVTNNYGSPDKRVPMFNVDSLEAGYLTETDEEDFKILQRLACGQLVNTVLDSEYDIFPIGLMITSGNLLWVDLTK